MGACDFYTSVRNEDNAREAFRKAREKALHEDGHGGYSGTIAEKSSYVVIGTVESYEEAGDLAYELIEKEDKRIDDKWGPAGAIKFTHEGQPGWLFFGWASE